MKEEKGEEKRRAGSNYLLVPQQKERKGQVDTSHSTEATGACSKASRGICHSIHSSPFMDGDCLKSDDNLERPCAFDIRTTVRHLF